MSNTITINPSFYNVSNVELTNATLDVLSFDNVNNTDRYLYLKNLFNDVIAIINTSTNSIVARYAYDAYGNVTVLNSDGTINTQSSFIGNINPIRYRCYYYDSDLMMYYLLSRFYVPYLFRFLTPDSFEFLDKESINGLNLYAYAKGNPIMYVDRDGHTAIGFVILLIGLLVIGGAIMGAIAYNEYFHNYDYKKIEKGNVTIYNSHKMRGVFTKFYFLYHMLRNKHFADFYSYRTIADLWLEWILHNVVYYLFDFLLLFETEHVDELKALKERAAHVDLEDDVNWFLNFFK